MRDKIVCKLTFSVGLSKEGECLTESTILQSGKAVTGIWGKAKLPTENT